MEIDPSAGRTQLLGRAIRRRCPRCGSKAFDSWFRMNEYCASCGLEFQREPGYWVGAMIMNTTLVFGTFIVTLVGMIVATWPDPNWFAVLVVTVVVNTVVPIVFYPLSKTIWSALELSWHPLESEEILAAETRVRDA